MKILTVLLAAGLAAACSKDADKQPGAAPGTGGASAAGATARGGKGMPTAADCDERAGLVIARLCKTDGWSGEAVACGLTARDTANECDALLTAAQKAKMAAE